MRKKPVLITRTVISVPGDDGATDFPRPLQSPGPSSASTLSPGCAPSAPVGSMGFVTENSGVASAALTHAVLDRPLFQQCFEQVLVSRSSGARPFVVVYARCKGSCNMTAEDRHDNPGRSSRPRKGDFDPAQGLTEALKGLVSKHKHCFHPAITELTWDLLNSSWQPGPSASSSQPSEPTAVVCAAPVTPADSCSDPSTATTQQGAQILGVDVVPPDTSEDCAMPNTDHQSQARPHHGRHLLRLILASWRDAQATEAVPSRSNAAIESPLSGVKHAMHSPAAPSHAKKPRADSTSPSLLESFERIKLKGKDAMIDTMNRRLTV